MFCFRLFCFAFCNTHTRPWACASERLYFWIMYYRPKSELCVHFFFRVRFTYVESYRRWKKLREWAKVASSSGSGQKNQAASVPMNTCKLCASFSSSSKCSAFLFSFCPVVCLFFSQYNTCDFVQRTHCFSFSCSFRVLFLFRYPRAYNNEEKNIRNEQEKKKKTATAMMMMLAVCVWPSIRQRRNVWQKCFASIRKPKTLKRYIRTSNAIDWAILLTGHSRVAVVPRLINTEQRLFILRVPQ